MSATMRAKMEVTSVEPYSGGGQETLKLNAVTNGSAEDNSFPKFTPSASLTMVISNPDLLGKFESGQKFYVDFTAVEAEPVVDADQENLGGDVQADQEENPAE